MIQILQDVRDNIERRIEREFIEGETEEKLSEKRQELNELLAKGFSEGEVKEFISNCEEHAEESNEFKNQKFWEKKVIKPLKENIDN